MRRAVLGDIFYLSNPDWSAWNTWEGPARFVPSDSYPLVWDHFHSELPEENDSGVFWKYYLKNLVTDLGVGK